MPQVNKQTATGPARPPADDGDPLSRIVPVASLRGEWDRFCLYGANRVGKTTLACQWPKPLLIVAFEPNPTGGSKSVQKVPGVAHVRLTNSADGLALCKALQASGGTVPPHLLKDQGVATAAAKAGGKFASYVVDGATSYQDIVLQEVCGWTKVPEQLSLRLLGATDAERKAKYQERAEKTKEGLRPFTNLPGHVILIAQEKDHNPPKDDFASVNALRGGLQTESFFASDVGGGVAKWLHDVCDYIGRLMIVKEYREETRTTKFQGKDVERTSVVETGRNIRRLWTVYNPNWAAGFRSADPGKVPDYIDEPTYAKIAAIIR